MAAVVLDAPIFGGLHLCGGWCVLKVGGSLAVLRARAWPKKARIGAMCCGDVKCCGGCKNDGSGVERGQAGPRGVEHRTLFTNGLGTAAMTEGPRVCFFYHSRPGKLQRRTLRLFESSLQAVHGNGQPCARSRFVDVNLPMA